MRRHTLPVFLLLTLLASAACKEDGNVTVHSLKFNGLKSVSESQLKSVLATREGSSVPIIGKLLPSTRTKRPFDRSRFEADLERIKAFLADRGFPAASVSSFDVKLNAKQDAVDITVNIVEGEPIILTEVHFVGFEALDDDDEKNLLDHTGIKVGKPRDRQVVAAAHEVAVNELRDSGFPYARVVTGESLSDNGKEASITFTAEPGPLSHFGSIEIVGTKSVEEQHIRRQLRIKPGDLYRRTRVQDSQRRLYAMALFQFVNIETLDTESQNPEVKMRVTIAEGKHQRLNGGVGYGSDEHGRVEGEYHHVNFFGAGRAAGVHARYSSLDRGVRFDFAQPYFFGPTLSLAAEAQRWYTFTPAYESIVTGGHVSIIHKPSVKTVFTLSLSSEQSTSSVSPEALADPSSIPDLIALGLNPLTGKQEGTLTAISFDWQRTTTNSVLDATRGYQFVVHTEEAGNLLPGSFSYLGVSLDARHYQPIGTRLVWANRLQFGNLTPSGGDQANVPFSKKYFLGGASSLRGWGRYEVSPVAGEGTPVGGNTLLAFSTEARMPITGKLGGVLFVDGGNVWENFDNVTFSNLAYDAGIGVRYQTPVGPLRFDFGYQLNPIEGLLVNGEPQTRQWRIHFSIGQAF